MKTNTMIATLLAAIMALAGTSPAFAQQDDACGRDYIDASGWRVWAYKSGGVEVGATEAILGFQFPTGYTMQGIRELVLWDNEDGPLAAMRVGLLKSEATGETVAASVWNDVTLETVAWKAEGTGTTLIQPMASEHGWWYFRSDAYDRLKAYGGGFNGHYRLSFDFHRPVDGVIMKAHIKLGDLGKGFALKQEWEDWQAAGCVQGEEPGAAALF